MPRTEEVTPYYIRSATGDTFYVDTLSEALEAFLGEDGYRLTLASKTKELVIRRTSEWEPSVIAGMTMEGEKEGTASLVWRERARHLC